MNIISGCKNVYHYIRFSLGLIHRNLFLFGRLMLLSAASMVAGIIITPLLSFFDPGIRTVAWYVAHIAFLGGLIVCVAFVVYLVIHILEKQNRLEAKKVKAEHAVRTHETKKNEEKEYLPYYDIPKRIKVLAYAKEKLLRLPWKKNEDE